VQPSARGHVVDHEAVGSHPCVVADPDRPQHGRPNAQNDPVTDGRVPLAALAVGPPAAAAEGDAVVHGHVVADPGGLAYHDRGRVVDEQPPPDAGAGMDLDAGQPSGELGQYARQQRYPPTVQAMGHAVGPQRPQSRVQQDLDDTDAVQRRIAAARRA
jgi:hypothetical protein